MWDLGLVRICVLPSDPKESGLALGCPSAAPSKGWVTHTPLPWLWEGIFGIKCEGTLGRAMGRNWVRAAFPNPSLGTAECPGQLRDSPCPAFPLAHPPRLLTSSVPALNKQLTTSHQFTMTPSHPAAPLRSASGAEHIPALAPAETLGKTTHDSNKPTSPSCPPTAQRGPGCGLNTGAGRKFACVRLSLFVASSPSDRGSCSRPWGSHVLQSFPMNVNPLIKDQFADTARCR